jgi:hypothetical protein
MKKYLLIISICLFSCSKSTSGDSMTEAEATYVFSAIGCFISDVCVCESGTFSDSDSKYTFNNCTVKDPSCSSTDTITLNGVISDDSENITFSGIIDKTCEITSTTICGFNLSDIDLLNNDEVCEALGLEEEVE